MRWLLTYCIVLLGLLSLSLPSYAQSKFSNEQLDQMLAPVALYPDALLSQVLMASTYPDDVAAAAKWSAQHTNMSGDAAVKAVQDQPWDPSVLSLAAFPSVLDMMGRQADWVRSDDTRSWRPASLRMQRCTAIATHCCQRTTNQAAPLPPGRLRTDTLVCIVS